MHVPRMSTFKIKANLSTWARVRLNKPFPYRPSIAPATAQDYPHFHSCCQYYRLTERHRRRELHGLDQYQTVAGRARTMALALDIP